MTLPPSPRERPPPPPGDRSVSGERTEKILDTPPLSPSASFRMDVGRKGSMEGLGVVEERAVGGDGEGRGNEDIRRYFKSGVRRSTSHGALGEVGEGGWL